MKKYLLIILLAFLITGCKANVNISIDKDNVSEKVIVYEKDAKLYNKYKKWGGFPIPLYYDQKLEAPLWMPNRQKEQGVPYYNVTMDDTEKTIVATGQFALNEHQRSSLVRNCFKLYNVISENDKTIFSTSKGLICAFNEFNIIVTTPYTVLANNASKVDRNTNTYTWNINKSNAKNAGVYLEIDFSKKYNEKEDDTSNNNEQIPQEETNTNTKSNKTIVYIIIAIIITTIVITGIYLYKRKEKASAL